MRRLVVAALGTWAFAACTPPVAETGTPTCATPADWDATADVTITAKAAQIIAAPGERPFDALTYDGDVPGPVLRLNRGESRRIKLVNSSWTAESIHFMGMDYDIRDDGTDATPESAVERGCAHVYRITAREPGVWPLLNHLKPRGTLVRGLYGAIVVPDPSEKPAAHEFVVFAGQLGLESSGESEDDGHQSESQFHMTLNGRAYPDSNVIELQNEHYVAHPGAEPQARVGDLVRWRIVNVSPDAPHSFGIHGHTFCDRGGLEDPVTGCPHGGKPVAVVEVSPLTSVTFEFIEDKPGRWMYHCHILDHVTDGMMGYYNVAP